MKKIICIALSAIAIYIFGITAFAEEVPTVGGQITLTQFLGTDRSNTKEVTILVSDFASAEAVTVDKEKFFDISDNMTLTSSLKPTEIGMSGVYITVEKTDGAFEYAYVSEGGGVDKYSMAMSRLPYAMYIVDDISQVSQLSDLAKTSGVSDWAKDDINKAVAEGWLGSGDFDGNYTQNITRERFCDVAYAGLLKKGYEPAHSDSSPFTDISSPTVSSLYQSGILSGKSDTMFAPSDYITREEAATILYRMAKFMNIDLPDVSDSVYFDDEAEISDWALTAVKAMREMGVMNGTSDNIFSPDDMYTVEQAIVTMGRLYEYNNR